jgi:hypothetical protein
MRKTLLQEGEGIAEVKPRVEQNVASRKGLGLFIACGENWRQFWKYQHLSNLNRKKHIFIQLSFSVSRVKFTLLTEKLNCMKIV